MARFTRRSMRGAQGEADCFYCVGVPWNSRSGDDPIEGSDGAGRWTDNETGNDICTPHKNKIQRALDDGVAQ